MGHVIDHGACPTRQEMDADTDANPDGSFVSCFLPLGAPLDSHGGRGTDSTTWAGTLAIAAVSGHSRPSVDRGTQVSPIG